MAYGAFGDPRKVAAKKMRKGKGGINPKLIDFLTMVGQGIATAKGGPAAGAMVGSVGQAVKGAAGKDPQAMTAGVLGAMKAKGAMNNIEGVKTALSKAKSLEAAKAILSTVDLTSLGAEDQASIMELLGKFK